MGSLRPFIRYYGGKWRAAPRYPAPRFDTIIEPFAGAAGYSLRHHTRKVILVDKYPVIAEIWRYLINVSPAEILRIPCVDAVADLPAWVPQEARRSRRRVTRSLQGPARSSGGGHGGSYGWGVSMRDRVASQVSAIRHWQVIEGDYSAAPRIPATYFGDSPYEGRAGAHYVHGSRAIDYPALGSWCRSLPGQVIVCEAEGATWLPFRPFGTTTGVGGKRSREAIWLSDEAQLGLALEAA